MEDTCDMSLQTSKSEDTSTETVSSGVKLRRPNTPIKKEMSSNMNIRSDTSKTNTNTIFSSNDDSVSKQNRYSYTQCENNTKVLQIKEIDEPKIEKKADQPVTNIKNLSQQNRLYKYNHPNENTDQKIKKSGECASPNSTFQNYSLNYQSDNASKKSPNREVVGKTDNVKSKFSYNNDNNRPQQNGFNADKKSVPYNDREIAKKPENRSNVKEDLNSSVIDEDIAFQKSTFLSKVKFTDVEIVVTLGNYEYWVHKVEEKEALRNLMIDLRNVASKSRNVQPIVGNIYGVLYEDIWHRAKIISLNPIKVHYIDYGNDELLKKDADIRDIRPLTKIPKFARKIRLMKTTSSMYKDLSEDNELSVRMLSVNAEEIILVEVQELEAAAISEKVLQPSNTNNIVENNVRQENLKVSLINGGETRASQLPSVLDVLADLLIKQELTELKVTGLIQPFTSEENVYGATFLPNDFNPQMMVVLQNLPVACAELVNKTDYE